MKAVKGNKVYRIEEEQKKSYTDAGFDILDDAGNVIAHGRGKTVSYDEYAKLQKENEELRARIAEQEAAEETPSSEEVKEPKKAGSKKAGE